MNIKVENPKDLELTGVYQIKNIINNKIYISSTKQCFRVRFNHHLQALRNNKHKNPHLQNAWNKYGESMFEFSILKVCKKEDTYLWEQQYLDNRNKELSYNINPNATGPSLEEESLKRELESRKKFYKECIPFYKKLKNGEIQLNEIPIKFQKMIRHYITYSPWNKNKSYNNTKHLKVPHKRTEKLIQKYKIQSENLRKISKIVYVYNCNKVFLDSFRSAKDLEELSLTLNLPICSRFKKERMGKPIKFLQSINILKAMKTGKTYKGLYFMNKPLHPGMDDKNEPKSVKAETLIPR